MTIKAIKLKDPATPQKGKLYEVEFRETPCLIPVEEKHEDGSLDQVVLDYHMEEGETGYFSKEYLPDNMSRDGAKRIDITAVMLNHQKRYVRWHLYDIKRTMAGENTVVTLSDQWNAGLGYLQQTVLNQIPEYLVTPDLGVITSNYDEERMKRLRDRAGKDCEEAGNSRQNLTLPQRKKRVDIAKYRAIFQASQAILDRKFQTEDGRNTYEIHIRIMNHEKGQPYQLNFPV